jgi:hypothetical protein
MKSSLRQTATPQHRSRPHRNDRPHLKTPSSGQHPRRRFLGLAAGAAALPAVSRISWAQAYPTRPVRVIVPFAAGGGSDILARLIGQWLSERLGRPFIIENRPGGGAISAPRWSCVRPRMVIRSCWPPRRARSYNALRRQAQLQFPPRYRADCRHLPRAQRHGREPIGSGQVGARVHRLRQGQSP